MGYYGTLWDAMGFGSETVMAIMAEWPGRCLSLSGDGMLHFMDMALECGEEDMNCMMSVVSGNCVSAMMNGEGEQQ